GWRVIDGFSPVEIHRVIDCGFRAKGVLLFEILLHVRRLVLHVEAGLDAIRDDPRAVTKRGRRSGARETQRKQQAHAVRSSQVEILTDHRFEEMTALHGTIEDLGQTHFELAEGQAMVVAGRTFRYGHRPRQAMRPTVEDALDVGRTERVTRG